MMGDWSGLCQILDWLRIRRHGAEYPDASQPPVSKTDIDEALMITEDVIDLATRYLEQYGDKP